MCSDVVYSPLCDRDSDLYKLYLLVKYGESSERYRRECGRGDIAKDGRGRIDLGVSCRAPLRIEFSEGFELGVDDSKGVRCDYADRVARGGSGSSAVGSGEPVSGGAVVSDGRAVRGVVDTGIEAGRREQRQGQLATPALVGAVGGGRGPNWERNRASREKKKRQKQVRDAQRASLSGGAGCPGFVSAEQCASVDGAGSHDKASTGSGVVRGHQEGFWNSCSEEVRQELIDSKARMHIAENLRKVKEAEEKVRQMESPEALLVRAMGMVTMAEQCAKKSNDSKVAGWAQTVATSYAESIAKSAPSSVPSYASVVSGSSATSVSVDGTKRVKPVGFVGKVVHPTVGVVGSVKRVESKVSYPNLTVGQAIDMYGLRLAESRTESDLDKIVTDVAMDDRVVGVSLKRITSMVLEKRCKFRRAAERAEVQRLGGAV